MSGELSAADVGEYLVRRGLIEDARGIEVEELAGGISGVVLAVRSEGKRLVVKQALSRFRVAEEWLVPRERALYEAQALELMSRLVPGSVPELLDVDPETFTLVIEEAPEGWRSWKSLLLEGAADRAIAQRLGELLTTLHTSTADVDLGSAESFDAQRVDPYLRTIQRRHPQLAAQIGAYIDRLLATEQCVVHGDFSPKNVLAGDRGVWVIDWEIVHRGDPTFDLAFMLNHLLLKTIHRTDTRDAYEACGTAFLDAYTPGVQDPAWLLGLVGCLMLARVDGKSPAEYLTLAERERARAHGVELLRDPPGSLPDAWEQVSV
jgi:5-methylthioribose kinase